jgi:hypothetical protein
MDVRPDIVNIGNKSIPISYHAELLYTVITSQNGTIVWPPWQIGLIPEYTASATLTPGIPFVGNLMQDTNAIVLNNSGTYYIRSLAVFQPSNTTQWKSGSPFTTDEFLWSNPLPIVVSEEKMEKNPPISITQVELDSAFALFPDNQTCYEKPGFINAYTCSTNIIPGKKVQCAYFIGADTCEPIHQSTGGTGYSCLDFKQLPRSPQWFDIYNTQNATVQIQLYKVQTLQNMKPWGFYDRNASITLHPFQKCTYGFGPIDEPLALDQVNMSFAVTYAYDNQNYTVSTPALTV